MEETLPAVRDRIGRALDRAGRGGDVRIVAVTKGHPVAAVAAAVRAGLHAVGENRVQELADKVAALGRDRAEWHLIGHLQRNKARQAIEISDLIHSVDSTRLAGTLAAEAARAGRPVRGLLQLNVSGEETKGGIEAGAAVEVLGTIRELGALEIHGLMTMAPWTDEEAVLRRTFAGARRLLEECRRQVPETLHGGELSMGMSNDFEIAVEEGATIVRLGTVLFGERDI
ncbi:MAG TPA: YggS family pyridoxal phosphate-dependent enzyme [Longimicrobiales bacterium]|nr:YggS family pyridoxal phosphate-dependent enzyme [Longimicrobiales bacterium]